MSGSDPSFEITHESAAATDTLLCGFAEYGLAGLTAVDYFIDQLELSQTGHITVEQLPTVTPFENGSPRHHTRLFSGEEMEFTVLVGELFVPAAAADPFSDAVLEWAASASVEEVVVASGVPTPHGPDAHRPFYIASGDYRATHDLEAAEVAPMPGGFIDGVNGAITARGMDSPLRTCVYTTPAHAQAPDAEAALRLLRAIDRVYDLSLDTGPLETFAAELSRHYEELAEHLATQRPDESGPADRMYM